MESKEWTIMIYMAGDNNLAVDMAYALEQIKEISSSGADKANLFVYYDGNSPSIPTLYCDFSEPDAPKYVRSFRVEDKLYPVTARPNENAADKRSILNFVDWCVNKVEVAHSGTVSYGRRAERYAMIFSGHSLGFHDIGLFRDETSGRSMKMADLYSMLQRVVGTRVELEGEADRRQLAGEDRERETAVLLGQKLDILGFDSCVMGMLEVGYQFGTVAKTMIASEGSVPNAGWTYAKILGCIARGDERGENADSVAEHFVEQFIRSQDSFTVGGVSVDMAAWDLGQLPGLAIAFDELSEELVRCFAEPGSKLYRYMQRALLHVHWRCQTYMYDQNVDLGDFCELLDAECAAVIEDIGGETVEPLERVREKCRSVLEELRKAIILSGFSGGEYQYSNGISIFFPWSREGYEVSRKNYESLLFVKDDADNREFFWNGFLKKYLNEVALRPFEPPTPDAAVGARYRYYSGVTFADDIPARAIGTAAGKMASHEGSKLAGHEGSKLAGHEGSKLAGHEGSKLAGHEGSKLAGHEGSKLAGHEGSKLAGHEGSKLAGHEGSKLAGHEGSKLAFVGNGQAYFANLRLFKNIESRWNISGFTKRPAPTSEDSFEPPGSDERTAVEGLSLRAGAIVPES